MAKSSALERLLRRGLLILLVALAGAAVYLWLFRSPSLDNPQTFDKIYQASVARAVGNLRVASVLGPPIHYSRAAAQYKFYRKDGHRHVRFRFPLRGTRRSALIVGEAVLLGKNWLVVRLVATFPGTGARINLTPGILT